MSLLLSYNFNENDTTDVRDYSGNNEHGAGTSLTISSSTRVGNECNFDGANDHIEKSSFTALNGAANFGFHAGLNIASFPGVTDEVLCELASSFTVWITTMNTIKCTVNCSTNNGTVESSSLSTATWYDVDITYDGTDLKIYVDETLDDTDATISGAVSNATNSLFIGADSTPANHVDCELNELKIYDNSLSTDNITALVNEQNGVSVTVDPHTTYALGDILASRTEDTGRDAFAAVSFVQDQNNIRLQPLDDSGGTLTKILAGDYYVKVGHFWDTAEQDYLEINETGFRTYGGINTVGDIGLAANLRTGIDTDGLREYGSTTALTSNTTLTNADRWVIADLSGGSFSINMPSSPVKWQRHQIKDDGSASNSNVLTIDGNGNNIDGASSITINDDYHAADLVYNGTEWQKHHGVKSNHIRQETASSGTVTINIAEAITQTVVLTITGNFTLTTTGHTTGHTVNIFLFQSGGGGHTVTMSSNFKWAGGSAPTLTTAVSSVDTFSFVSGGSNVRELNRALDVK